jgi:hypothetical protein
VSDDFDEVVKELEELMASVKGQDVGQKRFQMFEILRFVIKKQFEFSDRKLPPTENRLEELKDLNGYMYKLAQEFLTSSSTLEKERKLEKITGHFIKRPPE